MYIQPSCLTKTVSLHFWNPQAWLRWRARQRRRSGRGTTRSWRWSSWRERFPSFTSLLHSQTHPKLSINNVVCRVVGTNFAGAAAVAPGQARRRQELFGPLSTTGLHGWTALVSALCPTYFLLICCSIFLARCINIHTHDERLQATTERTLYAIHLGNEQATTRRGRAWHVVDLWPHHNPRLTPEWTFTFKLDFQVLPRWFPRRSPSQLHSLNPFWAMHSIVNLLCYLNIVTRCCQMNS